MPNVSHLSQSLKKSHRKKVIVWFTALEHYCEWVSQYLKLNLVFRIVPCVIKYIYISTYHPRVMFTVIFQCWGLTDFCDRWEWFYYTRQVKMEGKSRQVTSFRSQIYVWAFNKTSWKDFIFIYFSTHWYSVSFIHHKTDNIVLLIVIISLYIL